MSSAYVRTTEQLEPVARVPTLRAAGGYLLLALLAFVPPLRSDPGKVAADTKQYLYLDPGRLLSRAPSMWDPHVGMGTVTHQTIGYVFPMGPYYWVLDRLGVPDWVAQRLWLGAILFLAGVGVLYLLRTFGLKGPGVVVAALAYMLTPYTLDYSARISVLLLPFAALPWMIGLVRKAIRDGGWRYPAIFALVVQVIGGVNATALIFAGIGPVLWILYAWLVDREIDWRRALTVTLRIGVLTVLTSLWWIAGLEMQGTYGLDILRYTETVRAVATASYPNEVLRGLGYWFFYGGDRLGPWIEASVQYTQHSWLLLVGYGLVVISLLGAGILRWRHRLFFVALLLVGVVIAVGPSPYSHPTPLGGLFKAFASTSAAGLALRSTGRAVPLVVLGLAVLLGTAVNASVRSLRRRGHAGVATALVGVVVVLIAVNLPALVNGTFYGKNLERPENVPAYWQQAAKYLDAQGAATRVLEEPGADFASYTWGNTVDPITPGIMNRPYVARELIPYGTAGTADLLNAFDRRIQEGVTDPAGAVAVLRRMGVGAVVLRNDIQYQRYNLVSPRELNRLFSTIPGLGRPVVFGPPAPSVPAVRGRPEQNEVTLAAPANEKPPNAVVVYPVLDALPIVRAESASQNVMLSGDGEGVVDAADAGLLDATGVLQYSASYPSAAALRAAVASDAVLVVTDQNRDRARIWSSVRDNLGYTEQAGEHPLVSDPADARLPLFPNEPADALTTTQQRGVRSVQSTSYGNTITYTPEDRAARALDGDPTTAWRTAAFGDAVGQYLRIRPDAPVTTDHVTLVQPLDGGRNRWITRVQLVFDHRDTVSATLDASSRSFGGQTVSFPRRTFSTLDIRIAAVSDPRRRLFSGDDGVGFAEIRLRDEHASQDLRVDEVEQMPQDLLRALGSRVAAHPLVLLMTRDALRPFPPRTDPELSIARTIDLPGPRTFALGGSASVNPGAPAAAIDSAFGVGATTADASKWLPGCLACRADAAADGNPATAWETPFVGVTDQWVQFASKRAITFSEMNLQVVADGRHSIPTAIRVEADGSARDLALPRIADHAAENATTTVRLHFPALTGRRIRLTIVAVRRELATRETTGDTVAEPVGIAEVGIPGLHVTPAAATLPGACRTDLLTIDGRPVPVRISGRSSTAGEVGRLALAACAPGSARTPTITLSAGTHSIRTSEGVRTGLQIDRVVLASDAGGGPLTVANGRVTGLGDAPPPAPTVTVVHNGATRMRVHVTGADSPFWLVLGESQSDGWKATISGIGSNGAGALGTSHLVDGYANGWFVQPTRASFDVVLEWTPQRQVWAALWISAAAALMCLVVAIWAAVRARRRRAVVALPAASDRDVRIEWPGSPRIAPAAPGASRWFARRIALPVLGGLAAALIVGPGVGIVVAAAIAMVQWQPRLRAVVALAPAVLLVLVTVYVVYLEHHFAFPAVFEWPQQFPHARILAWLAVVLLAADVVTERSTEPAAPEPGETPPATRADERERTMTDSLSP